MLHVSRYGARLAEQRTEKKERKKKMNNFDFPSFLACHFKIVTTHSITGAGSINCSISRC